GALAPLPDGVGGIVQQVGDPESLLPGFPQLGFHVLAPFPIALQCFRGWTSGRRPRRAGGPAPGRRRACQRSGASPHGPAARAPAPGPRPVAPCALAAALPCPPARNGAAGWRSL